MTINTQKLALQALAGHGHVRPRPDGVRMRCGGPAICRVCQQEKSQLEMSQRMEQAFHPLDGQHINQGSADAAAEVYEREYLRDLVDRSLGRAYSLGQTYWMQADSESYSQNRRADETQAKFDAMRIETVAKFESLLDHIDAQTAEIARLREALRWTAGALQEACRADVPITEGDLFFIRSEARTAAEILNAANAALAQEQGGSDE